MRHDGNDDTADDTDSRTVLVVEDDAELRDMLEKMLESSNHTVHAVANGVVALEAFDPVQKIDLLLTDIILPGDISGVDLAERIRTAHPDVKIILISGSAEAELAAKGIPKGRYPLLLKPFGKNELLMAMEAVFARGSGRQRIKQD